MNEEEVREVVDDSKEKDKGKKTLKRSLTSIVKKLKSIESTFRETSRPNHKQKDGRFTKANVNSWRNQILTLKKKFSRDKV